MQGGREAGEGPTPQVRGAIREGKDECRIHALGKADPYTDSFLLSLGKYELLFRTHRSTTVTLKVSSRASLVAGGKESTRQQCRLHPRCRKTHVPQSSYRA